MQALILEHHEPLSKALDFILEKGTAVFVVKNKKFIGLIDDRNMRFGISDASKTKCENACVKAPIIKESFSIKEKIDAFLSGHFKALPIINDNEEIVNSITRSDLLRELVENKLVPPYPIYQYMSTPLYSIESSLTIGEAKSEMKKNKTHYLAVTEKNKLVGIISTLDFSSFLLKPKERKSSIIIDEVKNIDTKKVKEVMREPFTIDENLNLIEAAIKMAQNNVSHLVTLRDGKPVGIVAASDIFKLIKKINEEENKIVISGLDEDNLSYYQSIKEEVEAILKKATKFAKVENIHIHIKKGKSVFELTMQFDLNNKKTSIRVEGYDLEEAISLLTKELKVIFEKNKSKRLERKKSKMSDEG